MKSVFLKSGLLLLLLTNYASLHAQNFEYVDSGTDFLLYDVSIPVGQNAIAYAAGAQFTSNSDGIIIKSSDGGFTWSTIYPTSGTIDGIEKIEFLDTMTGYAVGYDLFIKTTDGGVTWTDVVVAADVWYYKSLNFYDSNIGIVTVFTNSSGFEVYTTADGGVTWSPITSTANMPTFAVDYADATTLYAVGSNEVISKSVDAGQTWAELQSGTPTFINFEVFFTDANNGIVSGEDGTIHTTQDGGTTWDTYSNGYHNFYALTYDSNIGFWYAAGTDQDVYFSEDNGVTWGLAHDGENVATFYDMEFFENGVGLVCGSQGRMLKVDPIFVGYDDYEVTAAIQMAYNKLSSVLTISSSEFVSEVSLYSIDGKLIRQMHVENSEVVIATAHLTDGMYFVNIRIGNSKRMLKFLKY